MLPLLRPKNIDLGELALIQENIAHRVVQKNGFRKIETIAGCDISFAKGDRARAACVILDYKDLQLLDQKVVNIKLKFPYIPTFLAFRELEGMLKAVKGMEADVYMIGAQGIAHPRRAGLASHFGVSVNRPALGIAKTRLCGETKDPVRKRGAYSLLRDGGETIGATLRTQPDTRPIYVSIGHNISLKTAIRVTLETTRKHRLSEPLILAHALATKSI